MSNSNLENNGFDKLGWNSPSICREFLTAFAIEF